VNIKIAGKWMFIPLKMYLCIGIEPYPHCSLQVIPISHDQVMKVKNIAGETVEMPWRAQLAGNAAGI
jgi:hypothetical protein